MFVWLALKPNSITLSRSQTWSGLRPGRRSVASWNLAYHALASQIPLRYPGRRPGRRLCRRMEEEKTWSQTWSATSQTCSELEFGLLRTI